MTYKARDLNAYFKLAERKTNRMFIQREIWSFYTSVSHHCDKPTRSIVADRDSKCCSLERTKCVMKIRAQEMQSGKKISLRLLRKALEKVTPRRIRSLSTSRTHTSPTTHPSVSFFSLWISSLPSPPGENVPYFWARQRFKFPAWAVVGNLKLGKALFPN